MKRLFRCAIALLGIGCAGCALILSSPAKANGRYPQAMQLVEDVRDPKRLWLRSTYGLLTSGDRGDTWHWICEEALGFSSTAIFDPMFGVHEDGTLIIGLLRGLKMSTNGGCSWTHAIEAIKGDFVPDLAVHPVLKNQSLALVSYGVTADSGATSYSNQIWKSVDNGKTFTLISDTLPKDLFSNTLDAAPSDPSRIYLSAYVIEGEAGGGATPVLMRSDDEGKTWKRLTLPLEQGTGAFIAAVHPTNADTLYVRSHARLDNGTKVLSVLLYSTDAGTTWRELFREDAPMLGFALSRDASQVFIGFGDPGDRQVPLLGGDLGLWRASTLNFEFEKVFDKTISCLTWSQDGLYACSRLIPGGFDLGLSTDMGRTFKALQARDTVAGPLACDESTGFAAHCTMERWSSLCELDLGCKVEADAGAQPSANKSENNGGCGCLMAQRASMNLAALVLVSTVGLSLWRRSRRGKAAARAN